MLIVPPALGSQAGTRVRADFRARREPAAMTRRSTFPILKIRWAKKRAEVAARIDRSAEPVGGTLDPTPVLQSFACLQAKPGWKLHISWSYGGRRGHMVSMENRQMMQAGAQRPAAPFTLVVSDVHGYPELLENALRSSGFREGSDRLVFAGDFLDRGSLARECLQRLDELGAETLIGNHDQAIALGYWIGEQQEASKVFREPLLERLRKRRLNLVTSVDGVLISHAGLTRVFAADFDELGRDPARVAARLNDEYHAAVGRQLEHGRELPQPRILDEWSPQRLRVDDADVGPGRLLDAVEQIAGHTTPTVFRRWTEAEFRAAGLHAIDPGTYGLGPGDHPRHYRYAVIQGGALRVAAGTMAAAMPEQTR